MMDNRRDDICNDKSLLMSYLYDECGLDERERVEAHLAVCASCCDELQTLTGVRGRLVDWTPPEPAPDFRVVPADAVAAPRSRPWTFWQAAPAWSLAAALVLVVVALVANLEIRYGDDGLVVRSAWSDAVSSSEPTQSGTEAIWRAELATLESELRRDFETFGSGAPPQTSETIGSEVSEESVLVRVQRLIEESERRQQRELAQRFAVLLREADAQRQADLVRIDQQMDRHQHLFDAEVVQHGELMDYLVRVSSGR